MDDRRSGERLGWVGGWLGGFVWVAILCVVLAVQGRPAAAAVGAVLLGLGVGAVLLAAPWRHPDTPYWKLMLPVYAVFFAALGWLWRTWESSAGAVFDAWHLLLLLPLLLPFRTAGHRRWREPPGEPPRGPRP